MCGPSDRELISAVAEVVDECLPATVGHRAPLTSPLGVCVGRRGPLAGVAVAGGRRAQQVGRERESSAQPGGVDGGLRTVAAYGSAFRHAAKSWPWSGLSGLAEVAGIGRGSSHQAGTVAHSASTAVRVLPTEELPDSNSNSPRIRMRREPVNP